MSEPPDPAWLADQQDNQGPDVPKKNYNTVISMIAGSLVGSSTDVHEDRRNQAESTVHQDELPTLSDAARSWGVELDEKQFIAFKVICCSFFLLFVMNGTEGDTDWSNLLSSGLECDCIE